MDKTLPPGAPLPASPLPRALPTEHPLAGVVPASPVPVSGDLADRPVHRWRRRDSSRRHPSRR